MACSLTGRLSRTIAVSALAALPACGGGSNPVAPPAATLPPPTTTLAPAPPKLSDLSASVTSPQANGSISCEGAVTATVALTNRSASSVIVTGVLLRHGVVSGRCPGNGFEFTYRALNRVMAPNTTTVVLDQRLFSGPAGCCLGGRDCAGSCRLEDGFEVVSELGNVPAGVVNYSLFFQNCAPCAGVSRSGKACPPIALGGS
jgi:hypothetical protein